jgi:hypothetical protein
MAVEAVAEDACADPVWAPRGRNRVRHLAALVGRLRLPSAGRLPGPVVGWPGREPAVAWAAGVRSWWSYCATACG